MRYIPLFTIAIFLWIAWIILNPSISPTDNHLRVAFTSKNRIDTYDPARIYFSPEYFLLECLYSPLIELSDDKGSPISSIAKEYYWTGNHLHLTIRDDLTTIDGYPITIDDVIFSLKRLMVLSENTHGDFKNLACPDAKMVSVEEECSRMVKQGNTLVLKMDAPWDFLIPMLAAMDFAIVPQRSVEPETLKIVDYRNTSGPYYVEQDEGNGRILLRANPKHFHFRKNMAEKITLIPTKGMSREQIIDLFHREKIDHISTISGFTIDDIKKIDKRNILVHETVPINSELAYVTEKGKKRLSLEKRLAFAKILQQSFHDYYANREGYKISKQFFLPFGEGGFSNEDEIILNKKMESVDTKLAQSGEGIFLGIYKSKASGLEIFSKIAKTRMPKLKTAQAKGLPAFTQLSDEDTPDYIIISTDSGFLEDVTLMSYTIDTGYFGFTKAEGRAWLKDYLKTVSRKERVKKLKKIQLESLIKGWMIPLVSRPYVAVTRKPWEPHLSQLFANDPLWKIRKQE